MMCLGLAACDDDDSHAHPDSGHHHDVGSDVENDTSDDASEDGGAFCTPAQVEICEEPGGGAGCCESTRQCYQPPCVDGDCCPVTQ